MVLEVRKAQSKGSINQAGMFQTDYLAAQGLAQIVQTAAPAATRHGLRRRQPSESR